MEESRPEFLDKRNTYYRQMKKEDDLFADKPEDARINSVTISNWDIWPQNTKIRFILKPFSFVYLLQERNISVSFWKPWIQKKLPISSNFRWWNKFWTWMKWADQMSINALQQTLIGHMCFLEREIQLDRFTAHLQVSVLLERPEVMAFVMWNLPCRPAHFFAGAVVGMTWFTHTHRHATHPLVNLLSVDFTTLVLFATGIPDAEFSGLEPRIMRIE